MEHILEVKNLNVSFKSYLGTVRAVQGVDFVLDQKETLAMVGESGCGKTVTAKSILRLFGRTTGTIADGSQILDRKSTRLNSSHRSQSRMPSSA